MDSGKNFTIENLILYGTPLMSLFFLIKKVSLRFSSEMAKALVRTFVVRFVTAVGVLFLFFIIARLYGPAGVGVYSLAYSFLMGCGILSKIGMDNALMRYVGADRSNPIILTYLRFAVMRCFYISLIAVLIIIGARFILEDFFGSEGLSGILFGISFAIPAYALSFLLAGFFKGVRKPATACLLENGSISLLTAVSILLFDIFDVTLSLSDVGFVYAIAAWLVALQGSYKLFRWFRHQPWWSKRNKLIKKATYKNLNPLQQFNISSQCFFVSNLASFLQAVLGVMIAGWLLNSNDLGLFKTSQQLGLLISFILIVINANFPPRFASLFIEGKLKQLEKLARQGALLGGVFGIPFLALFLIFPGWVLSWFGNEFREGAQLLRIIACAQFVNVFTGSVGFLLNMTGYERLMRNIAIICQLFGLFSFLLLIPLFGALGAALALALALVTQNLVAVFYVWRRLKIWVLPIPNLLIF